MTTFISVVGFSLAACASDGRELAEPRADQTTTTRPPPPTSAPPQIISESGLSLSSPDFEPGADAPEGVKCTGGNVFPNLAWEGVPADTAEMAIALIDQTDPEEPLLFWLAAGLDPATNGLSAGFLPNGAYETLNDYGQLGWGNPCLESAFDGRRDLQFKLYILENPSGVAPSQAGNEAWDLVVSQATDSASVLMRINSSTS